jgi:hypothetical protein
MMNPLRAVFIGRWMLALALAAGYCCCGGCWHDHHEDRDGGDRAWHADDHRDFHDEHRDDHHEDHHY